METIKTCPHCNGPAHLKSSFRSIANNYFVFVRCDICGAQGKLYYSSEDPKASNWNNEYCVKAINAWNMRAGNSENKII